MKVGDRVVAEGIHGQGVIRRKQGRLMLVHMDSGKQLLKDRSFVHKAKSLE